MSLVAVLGAPGSGKSTLSRSLAARSGLPTIHLDEIRHERATRWGYTTARADRVFGESGAKGLHTYESAFELIVLEEIIGKTAAAILDCSGGVALQHTVHGNRRLTRALSGMDMIVVTTPSFDPQPSHAAVLARRLAERTGDPYVDEWIARGGLSLLSSLDEAARRVTHPNLHRVITTDPRNIDAFVESFDHDLGGWRRHDVEFGVGTG